MKKKFKKIILIVSLILLIAQFFGPSKNIGDSTDLQPFILDTKPSTQVQKILKTSCYDCHSSRTEYPWYSNITPVNYFLANHVKDGKKHLDFSIWNSYNAKRKDHKMEEIIKVVESEEMPLKSYTLIHGEAKLSPKQVESILAWVQEVRNTYQ